MLIIEHIIIVCILSCFLVWLSIKTVELFFKAKHKIWYYIRFRIEEPELKRKYEKLSEQMDPLIECLKIYDNGLLELKEKYSYKEELVNDIKDLIKKRLDVKMKSWVN